MPFDPDDPFGPIRPVPPPPRAGQGPSAPPAPNSIGPASSDPEATVRLSADAPLPGGAQSGAPLPPSRAGAFGGFNFDDLPPAADLYIPAGTPGAAPRHPAQDGDTVRLGAPAAGAGRPVDPDATIRLGGRPGSGVAGRLDAEPVVGWLVVSSGPARGRDFRLLAGRTTIGRDARMDVALPFDPQVSRERHAIVSYDPRANAFRLLPGDGSGLVYLNGTAVDVPTSLSAYDRIEIGKTTLVFVPLCTEAFQWTAS